MTPHPASPPERIAIVWSRATRRSAATSVRLAAVCLGLLWTSTALGAPDCAMDSITHCATAGDLIWSPSFEPALDGFVDDRKVGWLGRQVPLSDVVLEVMGGAPDDVARVSDDLLRFSAVRLHSATERGAVFVSAEGAIAAIGVLHFNCESGCDKSYSLSMLLTREDAGLASQVRAWGDAQMALNRQSGFEEDLTVIGRVEVLK